ncbi:hypothetical protein EOM09_02135 [bacterium]|nr:hypothetical protein [bacterium]
MIGFFIKKAFFDAWDNLIGLVISNLGFLLVLMAFSYGMQLGGTFSLLTILILLISVVLFSFHSIGVANITLNYSDYKRVGFAGYKQAFSLFSSHAIFLSIVNILLIILATIVMPFYFNINNYFGMFLGVITFWIFLTVLLALQYFLPLMCRFTGDKPLKTFKKSFIMAIGNLGTTLFLAVFNIIQIGLSVVTAGLLFGVTGISLANQDAFKLLLLKLNWLEENPEENIKNVNWEDILYEERENVGHRTIKNMIFPWKD